MSGPGPQPAAPGALLGGRVAYSQPCAGFRSGIEPVLLAAAIPARRGQRVLEGGSGAGAALLCLAARVERIDGVGIEVQPGLAAVARDNAAENGFAGLNFIAADLLGLSQADGLFHHAFANPPYHLGGTPSPDPVRERAKRASSGLIEDWIAALAGRLVRRGTLTLITGAAALGRCMTALAASGCGSHTLFPLWPKLGAPAKLLLLQAVRDGRSPSRVLPGLVLHEAGGAFTPQAERVLRSGAALDLQAGSTAT